MFFDYLGIDFKDDGGDHEVNTLKGSCTDCEELLKYYYLGDVSPHYRVDRLQSNGAELLLSSEEGHGRMFVNETDDYKVISSSVVMGAIANGDSLNIKAYLLSEFVNYFIGYNPVTSLQENVQQIITGNAYPNPFARNTTISFKLKESGNVNLSIYDINGQEVSQLVNGYYKQGEYKINWDATNNSNEKVKKGFYFCRIKSGNSTTTKKIVVLH